MTILLDLSDYAPRPVYSQLTYDSNRGLNVVRFICDAIDAGHLLCGDCLVMDNAPVHHAEEATDILEYILDSYGIRLMYLPKYSPELIPCEAVFLNLKSHLRNY